MGAMGRTRGGLLIVFEESPVVPGPRARFSSGVVCPAGTRLTGNGDRRVSGSPFCAVNRIRFVYRPGLKWPFATLHAPSFPEGTPALFRALQ